MKAFLILFGLPIIITVFGYRSFHSSSWGKTFLFIAITLIIVTFLLITYIVNTLD